VTTAKASAMAVSTASRVCALAFRQYVLSSDQDSFGLWGLTFSQIQWLLELDFGHFPRNEIAGKWQPDEGFIAAA
jgi:hypothetical protein